MACTKVFSRFLKRNIFSVISRSYTSMYVQQKLFLTNLAAACSPRVNSRRLLPKAAFSFSRVCGCGIHSISEGDQQLLTYLKEEVKYEKETIKNLEKPKLEFFNEPDDLKNLQFKMTRVVNGESIVVSFNVDQSMNHETEGQEDEDKEGNIISYPSFSVQIIKDSGETLHFNCEYNIKDGEDSSDDEAEQFMITDVSLLPHPDVDPSSVYHCETENMDYTMYELLVAMLDERGINEEFLTDFLKKSTILEHQHYVQFLEGLQNFLTLK